MPTMMLDSDSEDENDVQMKDTELFDGTMESIQQNSADAGLGTIDAAHEESARTSVDGLPPVETALCAIESDQQHDNPDQALSLVTTHQNEMMISCASFVTFSYSASNEIATYGLCPLRDNFVQKSHFASAVSPPSCLATEDARSNSIHFNLYGERAPVKKSSPLDGYRLRLPSPHSLIACMVMQSTATQTNPAYLFCHVGEHLVSFELLVTDCVMSDLEASRTESLHSLNTEAHLCGWNSKEELQFVLDAVNRIDAQLPVEQRQYLNGSGEHETELHHDSFMPWFRIRAIHSSETRIMQQAVACLYQKMHPSMELIERYAYKNHQELGPSVQSNALTTVVLDALNSSTPIHFTTTFHSDCTLVPTEDDAIQGLSDSYMAGILNASLIQRAQPHTMTAFTAVATAFVLHYPNYNGQARFNVTREDIVSAINQSNGPLSDTHVREDKAHQFISEKDLNSTATSWLEAIEQTRNSNPQEDTLNERFDIKDYMPSESFMCSTVYEAVARLCLNVNHNPTTTAAFVKEVLYKANIHLLHVVKNTQDETIRYEWFRWTHSARDISYSEFKCLKKHKNVLVFHSTILVGATVWTCMLSSPSAEVLKDMKKEWETISEMYA